MHTFVGFVNLKKGLRKELKREVCYASSVRKAEEVVITVLVKKIKMHDYDAQVEDKTGQHCTKELATSWCDSELWKKY